MGQRHAYGRVFLFFRPYLYYLYSLFLNGFKLYINLLKLICKYVKPSKRLRRGIPTSYRPWTRSMDPLYIVAWIQVHLHDRSSLGASSVIISHFRMREVELHNQNHLLKIQIAINKRLSFLID